MSLKTRSFFLLLWSALLLSTALCSAQTLPANWRPAAVQSGDVERAFAASGLPPGQYLTIEQGQLQRRGGASIDAWLTTVTAGDAAPEGVWGPRFQPTNVTAGVITTTAREFQASASRRGGRIYVAVAGGNDLARLLRLTFSSAEALQSPQGASGRELMSSLAAASIAAARSRADREPLVPLAAPAPSATAGRGFQPGGAIVPGRYTGAMVNDEGKLVVRYDLTLFANGEYAAAAGDNLLRPAGTYDYHPATGRLNVGGKLYNSRYSPDEDFCLFGRDASGVAAIYVEDHYGIGTFRALLRRVGEPADQPPSVLQAAKQAAEAEAARYKFVTAPGSGLRDAQIEAVFYEWQQVYEIGGLQFKEEIFLLLKDGTARRGLPVPPQDLDVQASKQAEPDAWGRWRLAGGRYEFAFDAGRAFSRKQGDVLSAARAGLNLQGRYEGNSSYQIPGGAGAWSNFGVTFSAGQRFEKFRSGGAGMSSGYGDTTVTTASGYSDQGVVVGAVGGNFASSSSRSTPDTGSRRGTYRLEGHAIVLSYDNGSVERLPFVVEQDAFGRVTGVWMMGSLLSPPKK